LPPLALLALAASFAVPLAGAGSSQSVAVSSPDNQTPTAWFVQLAGKPTAEGNSAANVKSAQDAFFAGAKALGLNVTKRQAFGTLWNGVSVNVPLSQVGSLSSIAGVTAVYPVATSSFEPGTSSPDDVGSNPMIGTDPTNGGVDGNVGQGVKVAVIDSGIDYTNPDLGGCFGPSCRVIGGWDFVGDSYDDTATDPAYQPVPHPDADPRPCDPNVADARVASGQAPSGSAAGHGTHVAGIIGAKAAGPDGVTGIAPGVSFLAYRVFGCNGSVDNDIVMAALERAYGDGAQVINMSLGSDFSSWPEDPEAQLSSELAKKGVVVVAAEGNQGPAGLFAGGAPAIGDGVIAVGSVDNNKPFLPYFTYGAAGAKAGFFAATGTSGVVPTSGSATIVRTDPSATPAAGGCAGFAPGSLTGKVALIRRGTCGFYNKAIAAQQAGAVAVVLYNNAAGFVNPTVAIPAGSPAGTPAVTIPVVAVSDTAGIAIYAAAGAAGTTLTWTALSDYFPNATGGFMSSFSAWGPTAELGLKPDVTGPGGLIRSTWPMTQFGGHNVISGTSMSTPATVGAVAILLAGGKSPSSIDTLLSNYAKQVTFLSGSTPTPFLESPFHQGGGLIQVDKSLAGTVSATPQKIALGEGGGGSQIIRFVNTGSTPVTYDLQSESALSPIGTSSAWPNAFAFDLGSETVSFSSPSVTVPTHGQAFVTASVAIDTVATGTEGELYGGFIQAVPRGGGSTISIPYGGYSGDYQAQHVLTPTGNGFPWLASNDGTLLHHVTADGQVFTMTGSDFPTLLFHLNIPAQQFTVQVENADGSFVHPVMNYADRESYLARNSSTTGFYTFAWDGSRAQDNGNAKTRMLPDGTYRLKMSVLKPLGDPKNDADWESFTTPAFTIDRP
jgi:subtilisin family serine protease